MQKKKPTSREADKFVTRMPDGMRELFVAFAKKNHISMNTAIIQGLDSFLDGHADLEALLAGTRLLNQSLTEQVKLLEQERAEVAELKAQLEALLEEAQAQGKQKPTQ